MGPFQQKFQLVTKGPDETRLLGEAIGKAAAPGDVVLLIGELGAGKTCLTQGIARALGIKEYTLSPSFVLVREYQGRLPLYHIDLYRLHVTQEVVELGIDDYLFGKGVCVIEWADRAPQVMPAENMTVEITVCAGEKRGVKLKATGERYSDMLHAIKSERDKE